MRHLFVMNPHAGKFDRSQEMLEKIRHIMAGRRSEWSAVRTEGSGHATRLVQEAAQQVSSPNNSATSRLLSCIISGSYFSP